MTLLYAIIFPIIFPIMTHGTNYFSYYDTLFLIIFPIIFDYDRVLAPGIWAGADSSSWPKHGGMTQKCLWRMPAQLHRLEGTHTEWKAAWGCVPVILYALFFLLYALFVLADQDCGRCKCVLGTAFPCTQLLCFFNEAVEHQGSCQCCLQCPNCSAYMLLFCIM